MKHVSVHAKVDTEAGTHVLANAGARPGTELNHRLVHSNSVALDPAVRVEVVGIRPEDILVVLHDGAVDADAVAFGKVKAGDGRSAGRDESWHCESDARV